MVIIAEQYILKKYYKLFWNNGLIGSLLIYLRGEDDFFAAPDKGIKYICIQVKANSLTGYTQSDAII